MENFEVEKEVLQFLICIIHKVNKISIQNLTGYFSQLPNAIRYKFNTNKNHIKEFLLKYPEMFSLDDKDFISLNKNKMTASFSEFSDQKYINSNDSGNKLSNSLSKQDHLHNINGEIIKRFSTNGLIKVSSPVNAIIYFDILSFENGKESNFTKLKIGDHVFVNAKKCKLTDNYEAEYYATKVWRLKHNPLNLKSRYCIETSLESQDVISHSENQNITNGLGLIIKLHATYGYIKYNDKKIYFHMNNILAPTEMSLLRENDAVYFNASSTNKKLREKNILEATKVWLIQKNSNKSTKNKNHAMSTIDQISSAETKTLDIVKHIYDRSGKIYFFNSEQYDAIIIFEDNKKAMVSLNVIYKSQEDLRDDSDWMMSDGDDVFFDAVYILDEQIWQAVLVWIGEKPQICMDEDKTYFKNTNKYDFQKQICISGTQSETSDLTEMSPLSNDDVYSGSDEYIFELFDKNTEKVQFEETSKNWPPLHSYTSSSNDETSCMSIDNEQNIQRENVKISQFHTDVANKNASEKITLEYTETITDNSLTDKRINKSENDIEKIQFEESSENWPSLHTYISPSNDKTSYIFKNNEQNIQNENIESCQCDTDFTSIVTDKNSGNKIQLAYAENNYTETTSDNTLTDNRIIKSQNVLNTYDKCKNSNGWHISSFSIQSEKWPSLFDSYNNSNKQPLSNRNEKKNFINIKTIETDNEFLKEAVSSVEKNINSFEYGTHDNGLYNKRHSTDEIIPNKYENLILKEIQPNFMKSMSHLEKSGLYSEESVDDENDYLENYSKDQKTVFENTNKIISIVDENSVSEINNQKRLSIENVTDTNIQNTKIFYQPAFKIVMEELLTLGKSNQLSNQLIKTNETVEEKYESQHVQIYDNKAMNQKNTCDIGIQTLSTGNIMSLEIFPL